MQIYTVSFFGHRYISSHERIQERLYEIIKNLLLEKEYVEFLVGNNGEFDTVCAMAMRSAKKRIRDDNSSLILVLPNETADYKNNLTYLESYYDEVEVCAESAKAFYKTAITVRNKNMIDRSDLVICYVKENSGGAFTAMKYADKQNVNVINVAENLI